MKLVMIGAVALAAAGWAAQPVRSGNPILPGWYADPEAHVFEDRYWIYPTYSAPYDEQTFLDAFSSPDLVTWTKHPRVLDSARVSWARRAVWAPSIVERNGWYYLFFGANDIQSDKEVGGIGVARSRRPEGPFDDYLCKPLIDRFHNGAQPIDQHVFRDADGSHYIIYGGWRHCNIAKLNADFTGFVPFDDGTVFREITPRGYVEGAFMLLRDGKYYFMWSEGGWTGPNYAVAYAIGDSPFGPFERIGRILEQDPSVATGAGHHSVVTSPRSGRSYIVYHRRPLDRKDRNHRVVSIEELHFDERGRIVPVVLTRDGVAADPLTPPDQLLRAPVGAALACACRGRPCGGPPVKQAPTSRRLDAGDGAHADRQFGEDSRRRISATKFNPNVAWLRGCSAPASGAGSRPTTRMPSG
jgi:beta-xylosidase